MSGTTQTTIDVIVEEAEPGEDEKRCHRCGEIVSKYYYPIHLGGCDVEGGDV